ncbi:hypothetical protein [Poriferisphaera sp. WC338]|uniref:hypothetical protein n=1 Tax=Poriferisphaera sp. WC338 TaxID=3425129 RepID=UPI003D817A35
MHPVKTMRSGTDQSAKLDSKQNGHAKTNGKHLDHPTVDQENRLKWEAVSSEVDHNLIHEDHAIGDMILDNRPLNLFHETFDRDCLDHVAPKYAWQNLVLPIRVHEGTLICATSKCMLDEAILMVETHVKLPVRFTLVEVHLLEMFIAERYGYEGID